MMQGITCNKESSEVLTESLCHKEQKENISLF